MVLVCVLVQGWLGLFTGGLWGVCGELRESRDIHPSQTLCRTQKLCRQGSSHVARRWCGDTVPYIDGLRI
jgi:hypothetical protein